MDTRDSLHSESGLNCSERTTLVALCPSPTCLVLLDDSACPLLAVFLCISATISSAACSRAGGRRPLVLGVNFAARVKYVRCSTVHPTIPLSMPTYSGLIPSHPVELLQAELGQAPFDRQQQNVEEQAVVSIVEECVVSGQQLASIGRTLLS